MADLEMGCDELDRIGAEIVSHEEDESIEVHHIHISESEAESLLHVGEEKTLKVENTEMDELEEANNLHMTVIVQPEDNEGLNIDADMLSSATTQLVELGSTDTEHSMSLLTDENQMLTGQIIQLSDGTTAVVPHGFQVIQFADGTSALLTSGMFTDDGLDGSQLNLEQIDEQIDEDEEDEGNHGFHRQAVNDLQNDVVISSHSVDEATNDLQGLADGNCLNQNDGVGRVSIAKTFKCNFETCGRVYSTQHHLKVHTRSHTGDRPFRCEFEHCNKAFATGYGLKSHRRIHTGEKPYRCVSELCDKAFKTSGDLQKHMRTHTGERPFVCPYKDCNRSFTTSNIRKVHIRTHTGERPYFCDVKGCGKTFASATNYKNHIRIHSGEKPYVCSVSGCGKRFTEYSSLYKHHVVHTHTKPYPCDTCGKTYRQTSTLAMHRRMAHGDDLADEGSYVGVIVQTNDEASSTKQSRSLRLCENNQRGQDDTDGNLVIDTSDAQQVSLAGASPALLQRLPSSLSLNSQGSSNHVLVITDPSQFEAIQISHQ